MAMRTNLDDWARATMEAIFLMSLQCLPSSDGNSPFKSAWSTSQFQIWIQCVWMPVQSQKQGKCTAASISCTYQLTERWFSHFNSTTFLVCCHLHIPPLYSPKGVPDPNSTTNRKMPLPVALPAAIKNSSTWQRKRFGNPFSRSHDLDPRQITNFLLSDTLEELVWLNSVSIHMVILWLKYIK